MGSDKKKKVLVFGTFDVLHEGHLNFFAQAKEHGDYLFVVVARDSTVQRLKNKLPDFSESQRLNEIKNCHLVDYAVLGSKKNPYSVVKKINPDVICLGYDQKFFAENLAEKLESINLKPQILRLKPYMPEVFHSSLIKSKLTKTLK